MSQVIFFSRSTLSHNLFKWVIPLVEKRLDVACFESPQQIPSSMLGKKTLILCDQNMLEAPEEEKAALAALKKENHNLILLATRESKEEVPAFFSKTYQKPFTPDELAAIIRKNLRQKG